jgi:hypothetical protein
VLADISSGLSKPENKREVEAALGQSGARPAR